jgi:hypothetical protein
MDDCHLGYIKNFQKKENTDLINLFHHISLKGFTYFHFSMFSLKVLLSIHFMLHVFMIDLAALKNTFNLHKLCSQLHVCFGSWEIEIHCMQIESISVWSSWPKHIMVQKSKYFGLKVLKKYLGGDKLFDSPLISKIYSIVLDFIYLLGLYPCFISFFHIWKLDGQYLLN